MARLEITLQTNESVIKMSKLSSEEIFMKQYLKPSLKELGLLRAVTKFSHAQKCYGGYEGNGPTPLFLGGYFGGDKCEKGGGGIDLVD